MRKLLVAVTLAACGGPSQPAVVVLPPTSPEPPAAPVPAQPAAKPIAKDTYHGVVVEDRFRWLEEDTAEVKQWSDEQDRRARATLDALPDVAKLRAEITQIVKAPVTQYGGFVEAGGKLFGRRDRPDREQDELVVLADPQDPATAKLILDPTAGGDALITIDWFVPSPDGTRVAVSISAKGSEKGDLHVMDLDGKDVEPVIPHVQRGTAGGSAAWTPDGKGLYYTRYPDGGDFSMNLWFHAIGTPLDKDRYEMGKDLPKVAEIIVDTDKRGRVLAQVQNGDGGVFRHYVRDVKGAWKQLSDWDDRLVHCAFSSGDDLWCVSVKDAPRGKVLKLSPEAGLAKAKVVIAETKETIVTDFYGDDFGVLENAGLLYIKYQVGGPSEIRAFTLAGKLAKPLGLPPVSSVSQPMRWRDGILAVVGSYTQPYTWYRSSKQGLEKLAALSVAAPVDLSSFEVKRELATSKDGTKVPLNIVWPARAPRDGSVPCVVTGYGGFNISQEPAFQKLRAPLLTRGFCVVQVNLRGGGEFGEDWHRAGMLTNKQNVFDDFSAALAFLAANKYSSPSHLGIVGGSNGGLLMGAMLVQHPDQVKAVVSSVGIYDMLRVERTTNGQFNIPEYGTVANEAQFKALFAYSPYHHVVPNTEFPATLFMTGANDPRVEPWHSRKMLAAMLAAQRGKAPLLLRTSKDSGHGGGTSTGEAIEQMTAVTAFFLAQLK